jgi:hypothetical protein
VDSINAAASDSIEGNAAEEVSSVARRPARSVLARPLPDGRLADNPTDIVHAVALQYRRDWRAAKVAGATESDCERAAVDAATRRYQEVDPTAPPNQQDSVAATLEMVGHVILGDPFWFWHGPDA